MEKKEYGKLYKDTTLQSKNWRMTVWTAPMTYLDGRELTTWIMVLRHLDWTVFEDGSFTISNAELQFELNVSESTARRMLEELKLIGFISVYYAKKIGVRINANYKSLDSLCAIIQKNPGIGPYLRQVMGKDKHIDFIEDLDITEAKKLMEAKKNITKT